MTTFDLNSDLKIGHIVEVSGTTVKVELSGNVSELTRTHEGRVYRIGQIGSIVKIHFGRNLIFGFVTLLRMRSEEIAELIAPIPPEADQRVMEIEIFAEGAWNSEKSRLDLIRGISTYPLPHQGVYLLTRDEALSLYGAAEEAGDEVEHDPLVPFAHYAGTDGVECKANIDKMFGMHCAILGSTGSGKSGAVAALLHSVLEHKADGENCCHPRIVIIDPHGEYAHAFKDRAIIYRAYDPLGDEDTEKTPIDLPYWLMSADEFRMLVIGKTEREATSQNNVVYKALTYARMSHAQLVEAPATNYDRDIPDDNLPPDAPRHLPSVDEVELRKFDSDKPRPFTREAFRNHIVYMQGVRRKKGSPTTAEPVPPGEFSENFKSILDKFDVLCRDPRLQFMMKELSENAPTLADIIGQLVGTFDGDGNCEKDIRIVDISGLPNEVAGPLTAMLARLLFQYKLYEKAAERDRDPVLLVCEEAHRYVPDRGEAQYSEAQTSIRRIAREGRKYGIGLMLVSQRPADVESTVISQCGTWIVLRLTNSADQNHVARFLPDGLSGMVRTLPNLAQQEAIFVGEGAAMPARIRIRDLGKNRLPKSETAKFARGWTLDRLTQNDISEIARRMTS